MLALHDSFAVVHGVTIDDLHGVFLGVTLHLWFDRSSRGRYWEQSKCMECINNYCL